MDPTGELAVQVSLAVLIVAAAYVYWYRTTDIGARFHGRRVHYTAWNAWAFGADEIGQYFSDHFIEISKANTYQPGIFGDNIRVYRDLYPRVTSRKCDFALSELENQLKPIVLANPTMRVGITYLPADIETVHPEADNILILLPTEYASASSWELSQPWWYDNDKKRNIVFFYPGSDPLQPVGKLYDAVVHDSYGRFKSLKKYPSLQF